jgi:hypothetical protein
LEAFLEREAMIVEGNEITNFIMDQYLELLTRDNLEFEYVPTRVFNHFVLGRNLEPQWIENITEDRFRRIRLWYIPGKNMGDIYKGP